MTEEKRLKRKRTIERIWNAVWPPLALLLGALIFYTPIEDLITKVLVEPVFSKISFKSNPACWAFYILGTAGIIYCVWRYTIEGYRLAFSRTVWVATCIAFYAFFRFGNSIWDFTKLVGCGNFYVAHTDVLFLLLLFFPTVKKENKVPAPIGIGFSTDTPFEMDKENDKQQRWRYVETVYNLLGNTDLKERAFAVGISGVWGSGKTSFLNALEKEMSKTFTSLHFSPWRLDTSQSITEAFFSDFANLLSTTTDNSAKDLVAYGRSVTAQHSTNPVVDFIKRLFSGFDWDKSNVEELRTRIDNSLKDLKHKFAVYIDDLDRLDDEEILEVLRLVRNAADFPYVVFVVAYDKAQMVSAIGNKFNHGKEKYLEKIFQHEFQLPPFYVDEIGAIVTQELAINLSDRDKRNNVDLFDTSEYQTVANQFKKHLQQYRSVVHQSF